MPMYRIRKNHSNALPRQLIFFDTETRSRNIGTNGKREEHHLRVGHAICGRWENDNLTRIKEYTFSVPEFFWQWAFAQMSPEYTTWVIAHNVPFDCTTSNFWQLWEWSVVALDMPRNKRRKDDTSPDNPHGQGFCCIDDPPTIIGCRHLPSGSRFIVIDTLNYFRTPLEELGYAIGLPKLPKPDFNGLLDPVIEYCRRDVEILARVFIALLRYVRSNNLGMFRYTTASQAMSAFRHNFMRHEIVCHDKQDIKAFERSAFYGGQTEIFYSGKITETIYQLDCTAMYPSVMKNNIFPRRLRQWNLGKEFISQRPDGNLAKMIMQVFIETENHTFPRRVNGITRYAVGRYVTILAGPELLLAESIGAIKAYGPYVEYDCEPIFTEFVTELWKLRLRYQMEGNKAFATITKSLMNNLYGKFAQKSQEWVSVPGKIPPDCFIKWTELNLTKGVINEYRSFGWETQIKLPKEETSQNFPAIAAFATAYGRIRMADLRRIAGDSNVFYQGVDSLLVNARGENRLRESGEIRPLEIGKLREVYKANFGELKHKSVYKIGSKIIFAGRKQSYENKGEWKWTENQFSGIDQIFRQNGEKRIISSIVEKELRDSAVNGSEFSSGWRSPLYVTEDSPLTERIISCEEAKV